VVVYLAVIDYLLEYEQVLELEEYPSCPHLVHYAFEHGYNPLQKQRVLLIVLILYYLQVLPNDCIVNEDRYLGHKVELPLYEFLIHLIITVNTHLILNRVFLLKLVGPVRVKLLIITPMLLISLFLLDLLFLLSLNGQYLALGVLFQHICHECGELHCIM
jgi:hypothetical protein